MLKEMLTFLEEEGADSVGLTLSGSQTSNRQVSGLCSCVVSRCAHKGGRRQLSLDFSRATTSPRTCSTFHFILVIMILGLNLGPGRSTTQVTSQPQTLFEKKMIA
jgi:hypothetical protein